MVSQKSSFRQVALKVTGHNLKETQAQVEKIWSEAFPDYVYEATFLDERIAEFYEEEAKLAQLFQIFAGIAIFIGCLGLYGLVSFVAVQKTKEIGIRKVLGASVTNIVALLSKDFLKLVLLANIIAWPLAWWVMNKWLQDFEYRTPIGWWMFAGRFRRFVTGPGNGEFSGSKSRFGQPGKCPEERINSIFLALLFNKFEVKLLATTHNFHLN